MQFLVPAVVLQQREHLVAVIAARKADIVQNRTLDMQGKTIKALQQLGDQRIAVSGIAAQGLGDQLFADLPFVPVLQTQKSVRDDRRIAECAQRLERIHPAVQAVLLQVGQEQLLNLLCRHESLQLMPVQKVAEIGGLCVFPPQIDTGQIQTHRFKLLYVQPDGRIPSVQLIQQPVKCQQMTDARQSAAQHLQMA